LQVRTHIKWPPYIQFTWHNKLHILAYINCYRDCRRRKHQPRQHPDKNPTVNAVEADPIAQLAVVNSCKTSPSEHPSHRHHKRPPATHGTTATLDHHIFTKGEWRRAQLRDQPQVTVTISVANPTRSSQSNDSPSHTSTTTAEVSAIAHTGAQSDLWSLQEFLTRGFSRGDLHPVTLSLFAANRSPIKIEGAFFAKITAKSSEGQVTSCQSMVYVRSSVQAMYLSYDSLIKLGLLSTSFPFLNNAADSNNAPSTNEPRVPVKQREQPTVSAVRTMNDGCTEPHIPHESTCSCPVRSVPHHVCLTPIPMYTRKQRRNEKVAA
jgi:hypothetical protein